MQDSIKSALKILIVILSSCVVGIIIFFNMPKASVAKKAALTTIDSKVLYEAFEMDEAGSNKTYLGQILVVKGFVTDIETDRSGASVLILDGGDNFGGIMCNLQDKTPEERLPSIGSEVMVKGLCAGKLLDVVMNKCVILDK